MTSPRTIPAAAISTATIRDKRRVTVTGKLVGDYPTVSGRVLLIQVDAGAEVDVWPREGT